MKHISFFILLFIPVFNFIHAQNRYYVDGDATGANNGQNWHDAFVDLQQALGLAQAGDEVWVAQGLYHPTASTDRHIAFEPASGVRLIGGFSGTETSVDQRDWVAHPSILSGDIGAAGDSTDNSLNVVYLYKPDSLTLIDGFTICDGQADSAALANDPRERVACGGGLYIDSGDWDAFPTIVHCRIRHNTAAYYGGGAMLFGSSDGNMAPRFVDCSFEYNHSLFWGGGIFRTGGNWVERGDEFAGCRFTGNLAGGRGGGICYDDTEGPNKFSMVDCAFQFNAATIEGGGAYFIVGKSAKSGIRVDNCDFISNQAGKGYALSIFNNGNFFDGWFELNRCKTIKNSFNGNLTEYESVVFTDVFGSPNSGIKIDHVVGDSTNCPNCQSFFQMGWYDGKIIIENSSFKHNSAQMLIITSDNKIVYIKDCSFSFNRCFNILFNPMGPNHTGRAKYTNCIFEKNKTESIISTGILLVLKSISLKNSLFFQNDISNPYFYISQNPDSLLISNNIILDSVSNLSFTQEFGHTYLVNNLFRSFDCSSVPLSTTCFPGNLSGLDPLFRDTAGGDYTLLPCSPLIDAGSNAEAVEIATDITGAPRIRGGNVDIGPFESADFALSSPPQVQVACSNSPGGSITLAAPLNGCGPFTYTWQPPAGNGPRLDQLSPGAYAYTVTDSRGRSLVDTVWVPAAESPQLEPHATDVQCGTLLGGTANAAVVSGGTPPYGFQWNTSSTDSLLTMLPGGYYRVTVTDAAGCVDSSRMFVFLQGQLTLMVDGTPIGCAGDTNGSLSVAPANGKAPFIYGWSTGGQDSLLNNLGPGIYMATVTDYYGCTGSFTFNLPEPAPLQVTALSQPTNSLQNPNGSANASAGGGTPPHHYLWSTGASTQTVLQLSVGVYTVTVTDAHDCSATATVEVKFVSATDDPASARIRVWPNPVQQWLMLDAGDAQLGTFELWDARGLEIAQTKVQNGRARLDVTSLPAGAYRWMYSGEKHRRSGWVVKR